MPPRRRQDKRRRRELTYDQGWELLLGPDRGSAFADEAEARAAWDANRDELLADCNGGTRPWAFWRFEAPGAARGRRLAYLAEQGHLDPVEAASVLAEADARPYDPDLQAAAAILRGEEGSNDER
jgi:hypothetical protein